MENNFLNENEIAVDEVPKSSNYLKEQNPMIEAQDKHEQI